MRRPEPQIYIAKGKAELMTRISVSLAWVQREWLQAESERLGLTVGEVIRRIIDNTRDSK